MNLKRGLFFDSTGLSPIFWSKMKMDSHGLEMKTPESEVFPDGSIELATFTSKHFQSSEPSFRQFQHMIRTSRIYGPWSADHPARDGPKIFPVRSQILKFRWSWSDSNIHLYSSILSVLGQPGPRIFKKIVHGPVQNL